MAGNMFISWVHGSVMHVQNPERLEPLVGYLPLGPYGRILGSAGKRTWVHFAVPTTAVVAGTRTRVEAALLSFRTASHATVYEVDVYDGDKRIAEHKDVNLQGEHLNARFEVTGHPQVNQGINISVGVRFADDAPEEQSMRIEMIGAGVEVSS